MIEPGKQVEQLLPYPRTDLLRLAELGDGSLEPCSDVARHIWAELVQVLQAAVHLRHEPKPTERQEGVPPRAQVERDLLYCHTELAESERGRSADPLHIGIHANADQVGTVRQAQPRMDAGRHGRGEGAAGGRLRDGREIAGAGHSVEHQPDVFRSPRDGAGHLERVPRPVGGPGRHQASTGPKSHHPAEGSRDSERPTQVGSLTQRDHAGGERRCAAAGGAARAPGRIPGIAGAAEDLVEGVSSSRELGAVGLAQDHGTGLPQPLHHHGVLVGNVLSGDGRTVGGAEACHWSDVLDPHGQATEWADPALRRFPLQCPRVVQRALRERDDGVHGGVEPLHAGKTRFDDLHR